MGPGSNPPIFEMIEVENLQNLQGFLKKPYYQDDFVTIYHGDCREIVPQLGMFDLVLTDPPYEKEAHTLKRRLLRASLGNGRRESSIEALEFSAITEETRDLISKEFCRVCSGWILVFCQAEAISNWRDSLQAGGSKFKRAMIWVKPDGMPQFNGEGPAQGYESIATAWNGASRSKWNGGGRKGVFIINKGEGNKGRNQHQTQKPIKLMTQLITLFSNEGETILDAFAGSCTTARAAKDLGRKCVCIELEERYCEIGAKRMQQEVLQLA